MDIVFATNNRHKIEEVQRLLGNRYSIISPQQLGFNGDIPEDQQTLRGNAIQKAEFINKKFNLPCFADDTGLEVEALNGDPGVYSARYAGENKNSEDNIAKLLAELDGCNNRNARFVCVIAYIDELGNKNIFEGIVNGKILDEKHGEKGFGYDAVFCPDGYNLSFAQMNIDVKNKISHRGIAVNKFVQFITESTK